MGKAKINTKISLPEKFVKKRQKKRLDSKRRKRALGCKDERLLSSERKMKEENGFIIKPSHIHYKCF